MSRDDLLALTPDAVAALANRGLVKRAQKEIEAGSGPALDELADGTVVGRFPDGVETRLVPRTALADTPCSCGAHGVCRHRVAVALAYPSWHRAHAAADASEPVDKPVESAWSPGSVDDARLLQAIGKRALDRARALRRAGYVAEVSRGTEVDAVPAAALPSCTVRFLVPDDLAYVHCDGSKDAGEFIALAVWAFRAADARDPVLRQLVVEVSDPDTDRPSSIAAGALEPALALAREIVLEGFTHAADSLAARFEHARRTLLGAKLIWPSFALEELEAQLAGYRARSALYDPGVAARLVAELHARERSARTAGADSALPAARVLGTEEAPETPLDHIRLVSLGVRIRGDSRYRRCSVILADPDTAGVLVMRRQYQYGPTDPVPTPAQLGQRLFAPRTSLSAVAKGQIVTAAARRRANRELVLGQSRVARTSVTPSAGDWSSLPDGLLIRDIAQLDRALRERAPGLIRPRSLADGVVVLETGEVGEIAYHPGAQRLDADVEDASGNSVRLRLTHTIAAPGAIDELARALSGKSGRVRFVSGIARRVASSIEIEPLAVVTDELCVLDLAEPGASESVLGSGGTDHLDPVVSALHATAAVLEDGAHRGLRRASRAYAEGLGERAASLRALGLGVLAERIARLPSALGAAQTTGDAHAEHTLADRWADAMIRVALTEEAL